MALVFVFVFAFVLALVSVLVLFVYVGMHRQVTYAHVSCAYVHMLLFRHVLAWMVEIISSCHYLATILLLFLVPWISIL